MPHFVYPLICQWTLQLLLLLAVVNSTAKNTGGLIYLQDPAFNSFGYIPEAELLHHAVIPFLIYLGTTVLFSIATVPFYNPTSAAQGSNFSTSSRMHVISWVFFKFDSFGFYI